MIQLKKQCQMHKKLCMYIFFHRNIRLVKHINDRNKKIFLTLKIWATPRAADCRTLVRGITNVELAKSVEEIKCIKNEKTFFIIFKMEWNLGYILSYNKKNGCIRTSTMTTLIHLKLWLNREYVSNNFSRLLFKIS